MTAQAVDHPDARVASIFQVEIRVEVFQPAVVVALRDMDLRAIQKDGPDPGILGDHPVEILQRLLNFAALEIQLAARERGFDEPFLRRGREDRLEVGQRQVELPLVPVDHAPVQASREEVRIQLDGSVEVLLRIPVLLLLGESEAAYAISPRSVRPEGHADAERLYGLGKPRQAQVTATQLEVPAARRARVPRASPARPSRR